MTNIVAPLLHMVEVEIGRNAPKTLNLLAQKFFHALLRRLRCETQEEHVGSVAYATAFAIEECWTVNLTEMCYANCIFPAFSPICSTTRRSPSTNKTNTLYWMKTTGIRIWRCVFIVLKSCPVVWLIYTLRQVRLWTLFQNAFPTTRETEMDARSRNGSAGALIKSDRTMQDAKKRAIATAPVRTFVACVCSIATTHAFVTNSQC